MWLRKRIPVHYLDSGINRSFVEQFKQFFDSNNIHDPFHIISQNAQSHFTGDFLEASRQEVAVIPRVFYGAKWMFHQLLSEFDLVWVLSNS